MLSFFLISECLFFFHISSWAVYFVQALDGDVLSYHISTNYPITPKGRRTSIKNRQAHASPHLDYSHFIMRRVRKHEAGIPVNTAGPEASSRTTSGEISTDLHRNRSHGNRWVWREGILWSWPGSHSNYWLLSVLRLKHGGIFMQNHYWNPIICGLFYLTIWWRKLWLNLKMYVCESSHACFS